MINNNQTFVTVLEDINNNMINFERWNYKRIISVEKNMLKLFKSCPFILNNAIKENAIKCSIYSTLPNGERIELIKTIPIKGLKYEGCSII